MKLVAMTFGVVEQQGNWLEEANEILKDAISVVMYESAAGSDGRHRGIDIFAIVRE